ncbi:DUF4921 family protein [Corynebacterium lizhenjunii]|uniref:DUF4921 family protein n=1 Tax=Corynebacterium lizhenjunii TaxID=2709394 RepID=UPI0013ED055D|nr:DUF4921 family protein [Corynebacterium lizhenjunii]
MAVSFPPVDPIRRMADGTLKQVNPFSGTQVWTVPGRANRPLHSDAPPRESFAAAPLGQHCAFCAGRRVETPPEKSRMLASGEIVQGLSTAETVTAPALFRRVPNLFEIVAFEYWQANHGYELDPAAAARMDTYLADPAGREHVLAVLQAKRHAAGLEGELSEPELRQQARAFFGGGHDVIIGPHHWDLSRLGGAHVGGKETGGEDARAKAELAAAGTLNPQEHALFVRFTAESMAELYATHPQAAYVVAFQNWLAPAGASFDHLHKQLVAIDELSHAAQQELALLEQHPTMYQDWALDYAAAQGLIIAASDSAVLLAGFGHRYPTLEVYSTVPGTPWEQTPQQQRAVSDLLHAAHAAVGPAVASNEEWHHQPPGVALPQPWRVLLKLRVSTLAGFEGGTKIYVNTISPWALREKILANLHRLREVGRLAPGVRLEAEGNGGIGKL